ncbi:hypothetical protein ACPOL_0311 [Acidisarcina polymorpha]|uniref:Uncharacterized protein n=1 Tax=Acidisarcina polymorpha TaxID=2211140 RepID=A0A2Z5FT73_9BACT|nr:SOS response-associated peptidase family protein [Acidisarcina polymorpha]AXC09694.1 hypothetical protein ACPOL_0311 [Acidisarcina polymorpha]
MLKFVDQQWQSSALIFTEHVPWIQRAAVHRGHNGDDMRWGLVPFFTKQLSDVKGISTINAKAENVENSPTWRTQFSGAGQKPRISSYHW